MKKQSCEQVIFSELIGFEKDEDVTRSPIRHLYRPRVSLIIQKRFEEGFSQWTFIYLTKI